ncbi:protein phosphatase 2C domain-containing protein [Paractinoplanes ferrugineus]|uniref:Protein phosphatase n=1 Tax=Paractinoplanes ferrugineus TaxID=113564 RepID=A0A919J2H1_9ACTN|nr:protein phosphatase 2C domain-containing protein [Actinoplanes ferrugineus]GIE11259.1 protein phosphatase [Actinoplanes ferrugineus]
MEIQKVAWTAAGRRLTAAAASVTGNHYDDNYDVLHLEPGRPLAVVADGMGSGPGSATAGRIAVEVFARTASAAGPAALRQALASAQAEVRRAAGTLDELTGCTLTAFVAGETAWIVQIGDSRAYRLRDGLLELLTVDHTIAWLGLLHGWFTADSAEARAARYRLTRYVGHPADPEPDVLSVLPQPGDVYLLCSDGVADQLSYERLSQLLGANPDPAAAVHVMLEDTLEAGGADNATAVVIKVEQTI